MTARVLNRFERAIASALGRIGVGRGDLILVALSGGPDSVALLYALDRIARHCRQLDYRLAAAHLNHHLRGAESDRDEAFVRALCARLKIEVFVEVAETLGGTPANLEERARELRYDFLARVAARLGARHIAIAHHAGDQAETVMLRLLRGSGIAGLGGMAEAGPGRIIRPLLALTRAQILAYLGALDAGFVSDSSNSSRALVRNRVRHELLPMLERDYAPNLSARLTELAREMSSVGDYLGAEARQELERRLRAPDRLELAGFAQLHPALANVVLREWLRRKIGDLRRIDRYHIELMRQVCTSASPDAIAVLPRGLHLRREYTLAILEPAACAPGGPYQVDLVADGATAVADAGFVFEASTIEAGAPSFPREPSLPRSNQMTALFDAGELSGTLTVRSFRSGDRIDPLGMSGSRKLHDIFIDRKLPRPRRGSWPIVGAQGRILWLPGMVRSRHALITSSTRKVLQLSAKLLVLA